MDHSDPEVAEVPGIRERGSDDLEIIPNDYNTLQLTYEPDRKLLWIHMLHPTRPSFTIELLEELLDVFKWIRAIFHRHLLVDGPPIHYVVSTSALAEVFNWGGDLPLFVDLIKKGDKRQLLYYAHLCIEGQYFTYRSYDLPVINIALLRGNALGGGLEYALTHDMIVAEEHVKIGLPEVKFNLFPGMGAYSILSRRMSFLDMQRMILSGDLYSSSEGESLGIIDLISNTGQGIQSIYDWVDNHDSNFTQRLAYYQACRILRPVPKEELLAITNHWVECALNLSQQDLRKMTTLGLAQDRKLGNNGKDRGSGTKYVLPATENEARRLKDQASVFRSDTQKQLEKAGITKGMSCLDIGCGAGDVMEMMGEKVGLTGNVTGIDINQNLGLAMLEQLKASGKSNYRFLKMDIGEITDRFTDKFDLVFARFLLLHLRDPFSGLKKMYDMVKPGGSILIMDYDFRTMDSFPELAPISELTRIIREVFTKAGLDPKLGHKIPDFFEQAGLGRPDNVDVLQSIKPVDEVLHVLRATYESFLPMAQKLGVVEESKANNFYEEIKQMDANKTHYFMLPMVISAMKKKPT